MEVLESYVEKILPGLPPAVILAIYFLVKNWADVKAAVQRIYTDRISDSVDRREANQDIRESEVDFQFQDHATNRAMEQYERRAVLDILRDQLKHSRDDLSSLQEEIRQLRNEVNELRKAQLETKSEINKYRLLIDGHRLILSKIEEYARLTFFKVEEMFKK